MTLVYVALGGALGAAARYGVSGWVQSLAGAGFPAGTMTVNVMGSFLLGASLRYLEAMPVAPEVRALVTIGILGAFTTFSTFSYEAVAMLQDGEWGRAGWYMMGSMLLGVAAVILGFSAGSALLSARGRP